MECLQKSDFFKNQVAKNKSIKDPRQRTSPYRYNLVSIEPVIVLASVQSEKTFDPYNIVLKPTTSISASSEMLWFSPKLQPEPKNITFDENGNAKFAIENEFIEIRLNSKEICEVFRVAN